MNSFNIILCYKSFPLTIRNNVIGRYLQIIVFTCIILYFGRTLFIPLFFSLLVAVSVLPVCKSLERRKVPKALAIGLVLAMVALVFGCLIWLFYWEVRLFLLDIPVLTKKVETVLPAFQTWIERHLGFSEKDQRNWIGNTASAGNLTEIIKGTVNTTINTMFYLFLVPVFAALFLYHRRVFVHYLQLVVGIEHHQQLRVILKQTSDTYFRFIRGMALVYVLVGILNSAGLMALGVKHAILFGMLTAVMTIIPYVGIIVSALLPISVAWLTTDSIWYPVGVIAVFSFVQYLEANVIFPMVVGTQLNVSTWATLVAVIAGGILWGVAGMILFIPFLAILKIVSDYISDWRPLNLLLSRDAK
jgi:predicted PurR-regulated permease PerM